MPAHAPAARRVAFLLPFLTLPFVAGAVATPPDAVAAQEGSPRSDAASRPDIGEPIQGMVPEDFYDVRDVSDARISPDGRRVVFTVTTVAEDRRSRESRLWMVPSDGSAEAAHFTGGTSDRSPRWSPDGSRIAFLADRNGGTQLHLIRTDGGEAEAVTALEEASISDFEWLPDGERILLLLSLDPERTDPSEAPDDDGDDGEPRPDTVRVTDAVYKADGVGYLDERRRSLWLLDLPDGELRAVTRGSPDWNDSNPHLHPDGTRVVFNADRTGEEYDGGFNQDLWTVSLRGAGSGMAEPEEIPTPEGRAEAPVFSPDGEWILYRHTEERYAQPQLQLIPARGGEATVLTADVDLRPVNVRWSPDGDALYFTADRQGARPVLRLPVEVPAGGSGTARPGALEVVTGEEATLSTPTFSHDGTRMAFTRHHERRPAEVHAAGPPGEATGETGASGTDVERITGLNDELLARLDLRPLEDFRFTADDGLEVHGFLLRPVGWEEGRTYPFVLNIKGGPSGMWGRQWFHEFQMMAARGYAVGFVNYRGSTGYGDAHSRAVRVDYGGVDYQDNMRALETILEAHDWIDRDRLYVTGGSHGGFLTNWITTRTDRFRAAVTQRSVSNWVSEAGTQQYPPRQMRAEFDGTIWENHDYYWGRSPLAHADRVRTPTLVIHSDEDHITPIGQGQEWYYALEALGVPAEMVVFQGESHGLSRTGTPVNLVTRLQLILDWFDDWDDREPWVP